VVSFKPVEGLETKPKEEIEQTLEKRKDFYDYWTNIIEGKFYGQVVVRWAIIFGLSIDIPAKNLLELAAQDAIYSFDADAQWLATKQKCQGK